MREANYGVIRSDEIHGVCRWLLTREQHRAFWLADLGRAFLGQMLLGQTLLGRALRSNDPAECLDASPVVQTWPTWFACLILLYSL